MFSRIIKLYPNYPVHFVLMGANRTICGKGWLQATNDPAFVTCPECNRVLDKFDNFEHEQAVYEDDGDGEMDGVTGDEEMR